MSTMTITKRYNQPSTSFDDTSKARTMNITLRQPPFAIDLTRDPEPSRAARYVVKDRAPRTYPATGRRYGTAIMDSRFADGATA